MKLLFKVIVDNNNIQMWHPIGVYACVCSVVMYAVHDWLAFRGYFIHYFMIFGIFIYHSSPLMCMYVFFLEQNF